MLIDSVSDIPGMRNLPWVLMLMEVASKDGRMRLTAKCTNAVWKANGKNTTLGLLVRELWLNKACMMAPELQVFYLLSHIEQN